MPEEFNTALFYLFHKTTELHHRSTVSKQLLLFTLERMFEVKRAFEANTFHLEPWAAMKKKP